MTGPSRIQIANKFQNEIKLIQQNWEGYHLLKFANTIRPKKQNEKGRNELDKLLESNGVGGFQELQRLPSSKKSAFTQEKSDGVFKSLAEFQNIPLLVCFLNFLEFCRNFKPLRPLKVFNGKGSLSITIDGKKVPVTLDYAIDDIKQHIKNEEERLRKEELECELSRRGIKQPSPIQPRLTIPQARENNPNYFANAVLKVIGRDEQKARLKAFLECDKNVAWFQLAGVAGQGKSRLAFDLIDKALNSGWQAGFLTENDIQFFKDKWKDWQPDKPYLLIFDYVIGREEQIKPIFQILISNQDIYRHNIRILLIERQPWNQGSVIKTQNQTDKDESWQLISINNKAPWFLKLCEGDDPEGERLKSCRFESGVGELKKLKQDDLVTIVKQLFSGKELTLSDDTIEETLERIDDSGRPLYAYLLAQQLSEIQVGYKSWTKIDLLNYQLERDKRRWKQAFNGKVPTWGDSHPAMKLAVLATIVRQINFDDKKIVRYFGDIDSSLGKEAVSITSSYFTNDDNRPQKIYAVEPDLLGEWFVLYCFSKGLKFKKLLNLAWKYAPNDTSIFLHKITQDFIDLPKEFNNLDLTEKLLAHKPPNENHYLILANVAGVIAYRLFQRDLAIPQNIIDALEHAANLSDTFAMYYLGFFYQQGIGVVRNIEKAIDLYQKAADKGNSAAMVNLGVCYEKGKGADKNSFKIIELYRNAAELGESEAMVNLGSCYLNGRHIERDFDKAFAFYQLAVERGNSMAMDYLGFCYLNGIGIERNVNKAFTLFKLAIEQGYNKAKANLGYCYQNGLGVEQNFERAFDLYQQAARFGEKRAIDGIQIILLLQNFLGKGNYKTRKRKSSGWPYSKNHHLTSEPMFDIPILAGNWKQLNANEVTACLDKAIASFEILELVEKLDGYLGQYARLLPLKFYKDCNLVDIQLYEPSSKRTLIFSAIFNAENSILLNGRSNVIDGLNPHILALDDKKSTIDYLQFFSTYVQAGHGPFQIISDLDEIPIAKKSSQYIQDEVKVSFFSPRYIEGRFEKDGWQRFEACALYRDALFVTALKVFSDGMILFENNAPIHDKLPILQRQYYYGIFRTPLRSPLND